MRQASSPSREYLRNAVLTATPEQLQLMLYDGAIRFATRGLDALRANEREALFQALERAQAIVLELNNGIRREANPTLADQMTALYGFIYRRLVQASVYQDEKALEDALRILRHQRETWLLLMERLQKELAGANAAADSNNAIPDGAESVSTFVAEG